MGTSLCKETLELHLSEGVCSAARPTHTVPMEAEAPGSMFQRQDH